MKERGVHPVFLLFEKRKRRGRGLEHVVRGEIKKRRISSFKEGEGKVGKKGILSSPNRYELPLTPGKR